MSQCVPRTSSLRRTPSPPSELEEPFGNFPGGRAQLLLQTERARGSRAFCAPRGAAGGEPGLRPRSVFPSLTRGSGVPLLFSCPASCSDPTRELTWSPDGLVGRQEGAADPGMKDGRVCTLVNSNTVTLSTTAGRARRQTLPARHLPLSALPEPAGPVPTLQVGKPRLGREGAARARIRAPAPPPDTHSTRASLGRGPLDGCWLISHQR